MAPYSLGDPAVLTFVILPLVLVSLLVWGTAAAWRRTGHAAGAPRAASLVLAAALAWMAVTHVAATSGVLRKWDATPPPFALLVAAIVGLALAIALGPLGRRLAVAVPLWALVLVQSFRLPLELAMHTLVGRGIMPEQMSYTGRNFDIATGAAALVVAALVGAGVGGRRLVAIWNLAGLALLANVVIVAVLSTPRFHVFGDDHLNVFVTYPPFVWLPAIMVLAALAGHLVIFRAIGPAAPKAGGRAI